MTKETFIVTSSANAFLSLTQFLKVDFRKADQPLENQPNGLIKNLKT